MVCAAHKREEIFEEKIKTLSPFNMLDIIISNASSIVKCNTWGSRKEGIIHFVRFMSDDRVALLTYPVLVSILFIISKLYSGYLYLSLVLLQYQLDITAI